MSELEELRDLICKLEVEVERRNALIKNLKTQLKKKNQEIDRLRHEIALLKGKTSIPFIKALSHIESLLTELRKASIPCSLLPKRLWDMRGSRRKILLLVKAKGIASITWLSLSLAEIWNIQISRRNLLKNLRRCIESGQLLSAGILGRDEIKKNFPFLPPFGPARIYVPGPFMPDFSNSEIKEVLGKVGKRIKIDLRTFSPTMYAKQLDYCVEYFISLCEKSEKWLFRTPINGTKYLATLTRKLLHFFKSDLSPSQLERIDNALEKVATLLEKRIRYYRFQGLLK
jgi:hypothetical protein